MKINLISGSITYGAVTLFARIASIILIPILTRLLSPQEYGALSMILTLVMLTNLVVTCEVAQGVTVRFAVSNGVDRYMYPGTALRFTLITYLIFFIAIFALGDLISSLAFGGTIGYSTLINGAVLLGANGIFLLLQNQFRLELRPRDYGIFTLGFVLMTSCGAISGALFFSQPVEGVILGQAGGAAIVDAVGLLALRNSFRGGFNTSKFREMMKYSLPLVPAGLLLLGGQQAPKLILSMYSSLEDVGIYGLAYQIAGFSALAVLGVQTAITPSILANHADVETPKKLGALFERFAIVALLICSLLSIFASELVKVFSTSSYILAADFVPFLAFAIALNCFYLFFPGKLIHRKSAWQLLASIGSFLVAVGGGLILIRFDGVRGAALSALLSAITFFCIWYYTSQRLYRVTVNWLKLSESTLLAVVACFVASSFIETHSIIYNFALKSAVLLLLTGLIARNYLVEYWQRYIH
jgi:O-antigen/teichoic acid export membrane protein